MKIKTFTAQYEVIEFNHYMDYDQKRSTNVLDIVIKTDNIDFLTEELSNLFVIETENSVYTFANYELTECYEIGGGLVRAICVK